MNVETCEYRALSNLEVMLQQRFAKSIISSYMKTIFWICNLGKRSNDHKEDSIQVWVVKLKLFLGIVVGRARKTEIIHASR